MYQIDVSTAAAEKPTPATAGTAGYFTDGNPGTGTPATIVSADFMNAVQEELLNVLNAADIAPSKTDDTQLLAAIKAVTVGRLLNVQVFTSSGTYTPTPGTKSIVVDMTGGGGGGGGCGATGASTCAAAGGGAAANFIRSRLTSGFSGASVTIGAGGAAATVGANNGGNGGGTIFGSLTVNGGVGGAGNSAFAPPNSGGNGGQNSGFTAPGSLINIAGQSGLEGYAFIAASPHGGQGGSGPLGSGGSILIGSAAKPASGNGAGGAGAVSGVSQAATAGNAGAPGVVIIYEYA